MTRDHYKGVPKSRHALREGRTIVADSGDVVIEGDDGLDVEGRCLFRDRGVLGIQLGRAELYAVSTAATVSGIRILEVA